MHKVFAYLNRKKDGFLYLSAPQFVSIAVAVITLPIVLSSLTPASYGQWQFILALQTWGLVFSASQITDASKRGLALGQKGTFFYALFRRALFLLISAGVFIALSVYFFETGRIVLAFLSMISVPYLYTNVLMPTSIREYLIAEQKFRSWSIWRVATGPLMNIGAAVVAYVTQSVILFVLFQALYGLIVSIIALGIITTKDHLWQFYRRGEFDSGCVRYGIRFIPIDGIGALASRVSDVLIATLFGFTTLAVFSVARQLRDVIANLLKMSGPLVYADFVRRTKDLLLLQLRRYLSVAILFSTVASVIPVALALFYIVWFLPAPFGAGISYVLIFSAGLPLVVPLILLHTALEAHYRYKEIAVATIIPNVLKIILVIVLGFLGGIRGIIIALVAHVLVSFWFYYLVTFKKELVVRFVEHSALLKKIAKLY